MILYANGKYLNLYQCATYYPVVFSQDGINGVYICYTQNGNGGKFLITEKVDIFNDVSKWLLKGFTTNQYIHIWTDS